MIDLLRSFRRTRPADTPPAAGGYAAIDTPGNAPREAGGQPAPVSKGWAYAQRHLGGGHVVQVVTSRPESRGGRFPVADVWPAEVVEDAAYEWKRLREAAEWPQERSGVFGAWGRDWFD
jgi:hypothetical protein